MAMKINIQPVVARDAPEVKPPVVARDAPEVKQTTLNPWLPEMHPRLTYLYISPRLPKCRPRY
jgi:hypothetical protein